MQVDKFDQLMHLGYINQHENDLDSAYFCFDEALKFANSEQERTEANVCMATALVMEGDFQTALDLLLSDQPLRPLFDDLELIYRFHQVVSIGEMAFRFD